MLLFSGFPCETGYHDACVIEEEVDGLISVEKEVIELVDGLLVS